MTEFPIIAAPYVSEGISKREVVTFFFKYRRRLIRTMAITFAVMVLVSFIPTPQYDASTTLVVRLGPEYVYQPASGSTATQAPIIPFSTDQIFKSEVAILGSEELHREVIKEVGVDQLYPTMVNPGLIGRITGPVVAAINDFLVYVGVKPQVTPEEAERNLLARAALRFDKRLNIFLAKESAVINVDFEHPDPAVAKKTLDTLMRLYMQHRQAIYTENRGQMAAADLDDAKHRLDQSQLALETFKRQNAVFSFSDQRDALLKQRAALEANTDSLDAQRKGTVELIAALAKNAAQAGQTVQLYDESGGDLSLATTRTMAVDAEAKLKDAQNHYAADGPVVHEAQKAYDNAMQVLHHAESSQVTVARTGRNTTYDSLDLDRRKAASDLQSIDAQQTATQAQIAALNDRLTKLDSLEKNFNTLSQQVSIDRDSVASFSRKYDDARGMDEQDRERADAVRMIEAPTVAPDPKRLQLLIIAGGAFLAFFAALAVAAVTEYFRSGFLTPEQLERATGLPVLGAIPYHRRPYLLPLERT